MPVSDLDRLVGHFLAGQEHFGSFTVFHFESPRSSDLGRTSLEAPFLASATALSGHRFDDARPHTVSQLQDRIDWIFGSWRSGKDEEHKVQFSIHLSCHGNAKGIAVGRESLSWSKLAGILTNANAKAKIPYILALSSCGGSKISLPEQFAGDPEPPTYIFSFPGEVSWADAAMTWGVLYRSLQRVKVGDRQAVQKILRQISALEFPSIRYHRRKADGTYRMFPGSTAA